MNDFHRIQHSQSSVVLQVLIFFNYHWSVFFFLLNICLFIYKSVQFYYPGSFLGWDFVTLFCYIFIDEARLILASKGNKTATMPSNICSIVLGAGIIVLHSYYISLMTYVLRVDLVTNIIGLIITSLEMLMQIILCVKISNSAQRY